MKCLFIISLCIYYGIGVLSGQENTTENPDSLQAEIHEILQLIPREKVTEIAKNHLVSDDGFKAAIKFMKSDDWNENVEIIRGKPEWIRFKSFFSTIGFPVDTLIFCMESFLKMVTVPEVPEDTPKNLTSFMIDVEKVVPLTDIIMKLYEKQRDNKKFNKILEKLKTPETKIIVEDVVRLPEVKKMLTDVKNMGLDLGDIFSMFYFFMGWGEFKM
ncbi:uncharacterized protein LOC130441742 [Diorhabda sublineata]|uniref:uncharacterized protein LOC130441742 n=1 Tax=Diorhabda sublineata TaxID=1163346 RepID=UPI0024E17689|nr:uncharacterized protein LOC130441742 [Diorhabda sublineata]